MNATSAEQASAVKQIAGRAGRRNSIYPEGFATTLVGADLPSLVESLAMLEDDDDGGDCEAEDDDDDCASATTGNASKAGTAAPPRNGLFTDGTAPVVKSN